jgi:hypothetical protein
MGKKKKKIEKKIEKKNQNGRLKKTTFFQIAKYPSIQRKRISMYPNIHVSKYA